MNEAGKILKALTEAQYQVYNKQEETEEGSTPENRRNYSSEDLRNIFIGTIYGETNQNTINFLRNAINKMSDEWVVEFLKVVNGDTIEKVSESVNETNIEDAFDEVLVELSDIVNSIDDDLKIKYMKELKAFADKFRKDNNIKG